MDEMDYYTRNNIIEIIIWKKKTYLEPADVKSPHTSELGCAAGTEEPKSKRGAAFEENN